MSSNTASSSEKDDKRPESELDRAIQALSTQDWRPAFGRVLAEFAKSNHLLALETQKLRLELRQGHQNSQKTERLLMLLTAVLAISAVVEALHYLGLLPSLATR